MLLCDAIFMRGIVAHWFINIASLWNTFVLRRIDDVNK